MAHVYDTDPLVEEYVRRSRAQIPDITAERVQGKAPGYAYRADVRNRRRKKVSTFNIILFLFGLAVFSVLYISNIIQVNTLMKDINQLEREYEKIRNGNEVLRAELNKQTGLEYIGSTAGTRLGLQNPTDPPRWLSINKSEVERLARELKRQQH
jgi:cell division protein FtsB